VARHIVGQCNTSDFVLLDHLVNFIQRGEEVDLTNLTNRQKMAVHVLHYFNKNEVPFSVLLKIREVLIWKLDDGHMAFEFKLLHQGDTKTRDILRNMRFGKR